MLIFCSASFDPLLSPFIIIFVDVSSLYANRDLLPLIQHILVLYFVVPAKAKSRRSTFKRGLSPSPLFLRLLEIHPIPRKRKRRKLSPPPYRSIQRNSIIHHHSPSERKSLEGAVLKTGDTRDSGLLSSSSW